MKLFVAKTFGDGEYAKKANFVRCSQFRTIPAGMVDIFRTSAWNGTEMTSFRTGLNTGSTGSVPTVPAEISDFGRKMDTSLKQKHKFLCNLSLT